MNKYFKIFSILFLCNCSSTLKSKIEYLQIENERQQREIQNLNFALTWMSNEIRELNRKLIK